jgi:hypothetical protein
MNHPLLANCARALANRSELQTAATAAERVDALFRVALQRPPSAEQVQSALAFIEGATLETAKPSDDEPTDGWLDPWQQLAQTVLCTNEFLFVD